MNFMDISIQTPDGEAHAPVCTSIDGHIVDLCAIARQNGRLVGAATRVLLGDSIPFHLVGIIDA